MVSEVNRPNQRQVHRANVEFPMVKVKWQAQFLCNGGRKVAAVLAEDALLTPSVTDSGSHSGSSRVQTKKEAETFQNRPFA